MASYAEVSDDIVGVVVFLGVEATKDSESDTRVYNLAYPTKASSKFLRKSKGRRLQK